MFFGKTYPKVSCLFEQPREILLLLNFLFTISNGKRGKKAKNFSKTFELIRVWQRKYRKHNIKFIPPKTVFDRF